MILEIILLIIGLLIGFFIAWFFISKQQWGDKQEVLNEKWQRKIAELEKDYEVKIEKGKGILEKLKEENKTNIERLTKQWEVKYVKDIEELKKLFKDSEKIIKLKSVSSSRRSLVGKFIERFVPFLSKIPYSPSDMHFLGQPVDYIVFEGLHEDHVQRIVFLEVKTGESKLTKREKSLKDAVERKRVSWKEIRVDTDDKNSPDKEIENEGSHIKDLYSNIDSKIKNVKSVEKKSNFIETLDADEEYDVVCPKCNEEFTLGLDTDDDLDKGVSVRCPHCKRQVVITADDA